MKYLVLLLSCFHFSLLNAKTVLQPYVFIGPNDVEVAAEIGTFEVPENRQDANSRKIKLSFVKFPTTSKSPKAPIVYLAGGPGGSATGTAKRQRFPLFMQLREVADVILFDQRGTGLSSDLNNCDTKEIDVSVPTVESVLIAATVKDIQFCVKQWQAQGIDLNGYNTKQNAHDLLDLSEALGVKKINLWGISYGTHLAFAAAKYHPQIIQQMVLASSEGLGQTVKSPARIQALIQQIDQHLRNDSLTQKKYPNLVETMQQVLNELADNPKIVMSKNFQTGEAIKVGIGKIDLQVVISAIFLRDPEYLKLMPRMFYDMKQGHFEEVASYVAYIKSMGNSYNPMSIAMDSASGISAARWQQVVAEAKTAFVGRTSNFPVPDINAYLPVKDLGDEFRQEVHSDIPTLFVAGTFDGRTLYQTQKELAENFSQHAFITVEGAGHNVFMRHPDISTRIVEFFSGLPVKSQTIALDAIVFE